MGQSPDPQKTIRQALIAGAGLAVLAVILFILLYQLLSNFGALPRLLLSMCVPVIALALLVGGYMIVTAGRSNGR